MRLYVRFLIPAFVSAFFATAAFESLLETQHVAKSAAAYLGSATAAGISVFFGLVSLGLPILSLLQRCTIDARNATRAASGSEQVESE